MMNDNWALCFEQYNGMSEMARHILRRCAADRLSAAGLDEIGSSDINHELYAMWRQSDQDWYQAIIDEAEASIYRNICTR